MAHHPRRLAPPVLALAALLAAGCHGRSSPAKPKLHVPSPAWQDQVVYMVMTDRFANGDPSNDDQHRGELDPAAAEKYSGGDLQGIIDHLDYVQGLGATAVWITPPVANMWWDPLQQSGGYHGYWARHLEKVDEHLGTLATYQALSAALHARGMYLVQDVVPNHMGNFFTYSSYDPAHPAQGFVKNTAAVPTSRPEQSPFDQDDATDPAQLAAAIYHWTPTISNYLDPNQEWNYQISDLDDLDTENPAVRKALKDSYGYWIREVGVDAFRVDTAKFVPHDFWNDFFWSTDAAAPGIVATAKATGRDDFLAFGEVYEVPDAMTDTLEKKVAGYLGTAAKPELPSVLAFPLYGEIGRVFAGGQPTSFMTYRLGKLMDPALYPNPYVIPTFVDNHDVRRFLSISSPQGQDLLQALTFILTIPGIPVIYYGTEQAFTETRASMFKGGWGSGGADHFSTATPMYERLQKLVALRRGNPVFTRGTLDVLYDAVAGPGPFAYRRTYQGQTALVLLNTSKQPALFTGVDPGLPPGSVLEVLSSEQAPPAPEVGPDGKITVALPPKAIVVARATGQVKTPAAPAATIALATPVAGQTFTGDVTLTGTVAPASTRLQLVLDGNLGRATNVTVAADGTWSVPLPVSLFPTGVQAHDLALWAPDAKVATPLQRFTTNVVFAGLTLTTPDPVGDDAGPAGTYTYPLDPSFGHQMDVTSVTLEVGATTMNLKVALADFSNGWNPPLGFDHVAFDVFFSLPGQPGATVMPKLAASVPAGFSWQYQQFTYGWDDVMYTSQGATADAYGPTAQAAPTVKVSPDAKTVIFTYDRNAFGLSTWNGVRIYLATWDYDGIGARFRPLTKTASQWTMGGGTSGATCVLLGDGTPDLAGCTDPKVMDDVLLPAISGAP